MCLGIQGKIIEITDSERLMATADTSGVKRQVSVACIAPADPLDPVSEGVLIHAGLAISVIDTDDAAKTLEALRELGEAQKMLQALAEGAAGLGGVS